MRTFFSLASKRTHSGQLGGNLADAAQWSLGYVFLVPGRLVFREQVLRRAMYVRQFKSSKPVAKVRSYFLLLVCLVWTCNAIFELERDAFAHVVWNVFLCWLFSECVKFWRPEKSWHIVDKLISSLLHTEFRRAWCRQSSKWWSWCSAAEHSGFPTGIISMKWAISHHIFWNSQKIKSLEWNWLLYYNLLLSLLWEDILHQACSLTKFIIAWFLC